LDTHWFETLQVEMVSVIPLQDVAGQLALDTHCTQVPEKQTGVTPEQFAFVVQLAEPPVQTPLTQDAPVPHAWPHAPQLFVSVAVLVQVVPHNVCPDAHVVVHTPDTHCCAAPHIMLHPPQFLGSVCSFTQTPPQRLCPLAHA